VEISEQTIVFICFAAWYLGVVFLIINILIYTSRHKNGNLNDEDFTAIIFFGLLSFVMYPMFLFGFIIFFLFKFMAKCVLTNSQYAAFFNIKGT